MPTLKNIKISICIISRDRLEHLKQTLLINILANFNCSDVELLLLDYNSSDGMEYWIRENFGEFLNSGLLVYYRTKEPKKFNHSHAKNLAFKLATGDVVCNVNADHFLEKDFADYLKNMFLSNPNIVITPVKVYNNRVAKDLLGKVAVLKDNFLRVTGFDERMYTYGFEDFDFVNRLEMMNVLRIGFKKKYLGKFISHDNEKRYELGEYHDGLKNIVIHHVTPFSSKIFFLFKNGFVEYGTLVDNKLINSSKPINSYRKQHYMFDYSITEGKWNTGNWMQLANVIMLYPQTNEDCCYPLINYSNQLDANAPFILEDKEAISQLCHFHFFYKNRVILEQNMQTHHIYVNSSSFGTGIVFKNFGSEIIQIL